MTKQLWHTRVLRVIGILCAIFAIYTTGADDADMSAESTPEVDPRVTEELAAAEETGVRHDRDSKVEHLRKALALRPNHPENLRIEFYIAVELAQRKDPRPDEALAVLEHILATYNHMDYYSEMPDDSYSAMQTMMPEAGIMAANIMFGLDQNHQKAQKILLRVMEQMNETYQQRIEDWKDARPHVWHREASDDEEFEDEEEFDDEIAMYKRQGEEQYYEELRAAAASGDVLGGYESYMVEAAVRQYGYSHGRHRPEVAIVVMREIIDKFPGTPMAKVAQGHIDRALAMLDQERLDDLADKITYLPPPEPNAATQPATPSPAPSPTPPPGRDSQSNAQKPPGLAATITTSLRTHYYAWLAGLAAVVIAVGIVRHARKRRT